MTTSNAPSGDEAQAVCREPATEPIAADTAPEPTESMLRRAARAIDPDEESTPRALGSQYGQRWLYLALADTAQRAIEAVYADCGETDAGVLGSNVGAHLEHRVIAALTAARAGESGDESLTAQAGEAEDGTVGRPPQAPGWGVRLDVPRWPEGRWESMVTAATRAELATRVLASDATMHRRTEAQWGVRIVLPWWPEPVFSQHPTREEAERRFDEMTSPFAPRATATLVQRDVTTTATQWREVAGGEDRG